MFANLSPCLSCSENTLNTLRYADRVKELRKNNNKKYRDDNYNEMMVLPRKNNVIKYNVTLKKSNTINHNKIKNNNSFKRKEVLKMNDIINERKKKGKFSLSKDKKIVKKNNINAYSDNECESEIKNNKNFSKNSTSKSLNIFSLSKIPTLNNEKNDIFNNISNCENNNYISKYSNIEIKSEKDKEKYSDEYSKLIDLLLENEGKLKKYHEIHINEINDTLKKEKKLNEIDDDPNFNIKVYINNMRQLLNNEIESIQKIKSKLDNFENLLKDEEILSNKLNIDDDISN